MDSTYSMQFTDTNIDRGTWYFDYSEQAIIHHLYFSKPYDWAANDLIEKGIAEKDVRGEYFEVITVRVIDLTDDHLLVMERGRKVIYQKVHE